MVRKAPHYHAFMSHSHDDATWVEDLARRLEDECGFHVCLDKWEFIPGTSWQRAMEQKLPEAETCVICLGEKTPEGWFRQEIELALAEQTRNPNYRVIPVLLPGANEDVVSGFVSLRTWADFRQESGYDYALHVLKHGIKGEPPGRWPADGVSCSSSPQFRKAEQRISELRRLQSIGQLQQEVVIEFERRILASWFEEEGAQ